MQKYDKQTLLLDIAISITFIAIIGIIVAISIVTL